MRQDELLEKISDKELKMSLILSQVLFLLISIILSLFLFEHFFDWFYLFKFYGKEIFYYGIIPGLIIVMIDLILINVLPARYLDDGGINRRVFKDRSVGDIFFIALIIAICEELLFRGVFQTTFGFIIASLIFALVHVRYLKKPILFISVLFVSFYIGFLFEITGNLLVTMAMHFTIDFLLGLMIKFQMWGAVNE